VKQTEKSFRAIIGKGAEYTDKFYVARTVLHFGMKLYNDQRNAQVLNLFIYLLPPYMFRDVFKPIFKDRCTTSAVVQISWLWCQRQCADTIPKRFELVRYVGHYTISIH
jgi:hypothetical protein